MNSLRVFALVLITAATTVACDNSGSTTATTPTQTLVTETLTGAVPAAVNGVPQAASNPFTVGQGGGTVSVTLTSAVETLPGGTTNPSVAMGLAVGTLSGTACTLSAGVAPTPLSAGAASTLSGSLNAGTYCVQVSDVTIQPGPVAYTVLVIHP